MKGGKRYGGSTSSSTAGVLACIRRQAKKNGLQQFVFNGGRGLPRSVLIHGFQRDIG